jgi:hypothetical protein
MELDTSNCAKRRPTCKTDTWGTQIHLMTFRVGHPPAAPFVAQGEPDAES